jgi:hypothetical protein
VEAVKEEAGLNENHPNVRVMFCDEGAIENPDKEDSGAEMGYGVSICYHVPSAYAHHKTGKGACNGLGNARKISRL